MSIRSALEEPDEPRTASESLPTDTERRQYLAAERALGREGVVLVGLAVVFGLTVLLTEAGDSLLPVRVVALVAAGYLCYRAWRFLHAADSYETFYAYVDWQAIDGRIPLLQRRSGRHRIEATARLFVATMLVFGAWFAHGLVTYRP